MAVRRRREDYHEGSARISAVFVVFCFFFYADILIIKRNRTVNKKPFHIIMRKGFITFLQFDLQ